MSYWTHLNHALEITHHIEPCAQHRLTIPRRRAETSDDAAGVISVVPFSSIRVLVACEYSATVRDAFRARGFNAWSCDVLPTEGDPRWHIQWDVLACLDPTRNRNHVILPGGVPEPWDLIIAHPPCNHLAASGAQYWPAKRADGRQAEAIAFFLALYNAPARFVAVENPVGIMGTVFRKADQIIQPWQFGDAVNKKTALWLRNLPKLTPSNVVEPTHNWGTNSYRGGSRKLSALPSLKWGGHDRSKSFTGIAEAMALQWGDHVARIAAQSPDNRTRQNPERHGAAVSGFVLHSQTDTAEGA